MNPTVILAVGFGGFLGAVSRFLISTLIQKMAGPAFPYGTLAVNVLGSFIIGYLFLFFEQSVAPTQKAIFITGFLGALTTFSTFSLESIVMMQSGFFLRAGLNILLNVTLSLSATILGMALFKKLYGI